MNDHQKAKLNGGSEKIAELTQQLKEANALIELIRTEYICDDCGETTSDGLPHHEKCKYRAAADRAQEAMK